MEPIANWRTIETVYIETLAKEYILDFKRANVGSHKYMKVRCREVSARKKKYIYNV